MKKSIIKYFLLVSGVAVLTVGMLTGCGKKNDETKTYDKENEVTQSITNNVNYAEKLSTEEKIEFAYYLHVFNGDFKSTQDLSSENILRTLTDRNVNVVDYKKTTEKSVTDMFTDYNSSYGEIRVFEESELKKAAKDLLGVNLSNENNNFSDTYLKRTLKYKDGKYYYYLEFADGEYLTIKNISNNDNTYTFFALSALDSEVLDISEYTKYETVIENGVIKSCKEAMNTENKTSNDNNSKSNGKINLSEEDIVHIVMLMEDFENGTKLSTEQYLNAVYNALNDGYITIGNKRKNGSVEYTESEIKNIVKTLFDADLTENTSVNPIIGYKNGKYVFEFDNDRESFLEAKNIVPDVAAGTKYITYDLYRKNLDKEEFKGKYVVAVTGQNGTIRSKKIVNNDN